MKVTNEELVVRAKNGDKEAYEQLFKQNEGICRLYANKYHNVGEFDDLFALCQLGMLKAYKTFDVDRGNKFITYAGLVMHNEIRMQHRRNQRHRGQVSIDEPVAVDKEGFTQTRLEVLASDKDGPEELLGKAVAVMELHTSLKELTERERAVITELYFSKRTQREVADSLGLSQSYISRLERKILAKLNKSLVRRDVYGAV